MGVRRTESARCCSSHAWWPPQSGSAQASSASMRVHAGVPASRKWANAAGAAGGALSCISLIGVAFVPIDRHLRLHESLSDWAIGPLAAMPLLLGIAALATRDFPGDPAGVDRPFSRSGVDVTILVAPRARHRARTRHSSDGTEISRFGRGDHSVVPIVGGRTGSNEERSMNSEDWR